MIVEEVFTTIEEYDNQEYLYLLCALEVISLIGPNEKSFQRIGIIKGLMCEPNLRNLLLPCLCTLLQLGFEGFLALMDLAVKDFNSL